MPNKWISHVLAYQKKHPNLSYGDCLVKARASYKPVAGGAKKSVKSTKKKVSSKKLMSMIKGGKVPKGALSQLLSGLDASIKVK